MFFKFFKNTVSSAFYQLTIHSPLAAESGIHEIIAEINLSYWKEKSAKRADKSHLFAQ